MNPNEIAAERARTLAMTPAEQTAELIQLLRDEQAQAQRAGDTRKVKRLEKRIEAMKKP